MGQLGSFVGREAEPIPRSQNPPLEKIRWAWCHEARFRCRFIRTGYVAVVRPWLLGSRGEAAVGQECRQPGSFFGGRLARQAREDIVMAYVASPDSSWPFWERLIAFGQVEAAF